MFLLRFFLLLGILMQPFCGHCLAELRSMSEQTEATTCSDDLLFDSNDAPTQQTACTKSPCVETTKIDVKPLTSDLTICRFTLPSTTSFSVIDESVDSLSRQSLPLYLQLSVIRD